MAKGKGTKGKRKKAKRCDNGQVRVAAHCRKKGPLPPRDGKGKFRKKKSMSRKGSTSTTVTQLSLV